jgi:hypothetical protein
VEQKSNTAVEQKPDTAGDVALAFFFGIVVELFSWALQEFLGILPEPFTHFIPGLGIDEINGYALKESLLFSAIIIGSLIAIWFCAKYAEGLANSRLRRVFLLIGILVVGSAVSYQSRHDRPKRALVSPCTVAGPQRVDH